MVRRAQLEILVGLKHSTIQKYINDGAFPGPYPLGQWVRCWAMHEIAEWVRQRDAYAHELQRRHSSWPSATV